MTKTIDNYRCDLKICDKNEEIHIKNLTVILKDEILAFVKGCQQKENKTVIYHASLCIKDTGFIFFKINHAKEQNRRIHSQQAFYFIKYLFHKHVFHEVAQETITKLQPKSKKFDFAQKLLSYLKHHISEIRNQKSSDPRYLQNLKGVISYANSLLNSLKKDKFIDVKKTDQKEFYELEKSYLENIKASLENALFIKPYKSATISDFRSDFISIALFLFAITTPIVLIVAKHENNVKDFIFDKYLPYYGISMIVALGATFFISLIVHGRKHNYLVQVVDKFWQKFWQFIKKRNNPTLKKNNLFTYLVKVEMKIRRYPHTTALSLAIMIMMASSLLAGYLFYKLITYG